MREDKLILGKRAILAIDLDRTVLDSDFPVINGLLPDAREVINRLMTIHDCYIICWTSRNGYYVDEARDYLDDNGVEYDVINENHPAIAEFFGSDTRKVGADIYVDDKTISALLDPNFPNWLELEQQIIQIIYSDCFWSLLNHVI
jgi:hypothetical protein